MTYSFNASEVFDMAVRIEENGAAFYRKAAETQSDAANKEFLTKMAVMEDGHKAIFATMKQDLSHSEKKETVFDPEEEQSLYLAAMADSHGGEGSPSAADSLTGAETMEAILTTAIGLEKESILFYLGVKDYVPENLGKAKIDDIIREERRHVSQLTAVLRKVRNS